MCTIGTTYKVLHLIKFQRSGDIHYGRYKTTCRVHNYFTSFIVLASTSSVRQVRRQRGLIRSASRISSASQVNVHSPESLARNPTILTQVISLNYCFGMNIVQFVHVFYFVVQLMVSLTIVSVLSYSQQPFHSHCFLIFSLLINLLKDSLYKPNKFWVIWL